MEYSMHFGYTIVAVPMRENASGGIRDANYCAQNTSEEAKVHPAK